MLETATAATDLDLISYLKAIPDARMRRGVRIPAWYLLLVAVLGILSRCHQEQGADFLLTVKANQKTLHRQIRSQFQGTRKIPFVATDHEKSHGREITWTLRAKPAPESIRAEWIGTSWIVEVVAEGTRDRKPFRATHLFLTSLRTTPAGLLRLVRDRWSIEGWHWIRDTQLQEDAHRYRGNGAGAMASLRTAALNLLRFERFQSIRAGMQAVMHDITALLAMALRQPVPKPDLRLSIRFVYRPAADTELSCPHRRRHGGCRGSASVPLPGERRDVYGWDRHPHHHDGERIGSAGLAARAGGTAPAGDSPAMLRDVYIEKTNAMCLYLLTKQAACSRYVQTFRFVIKLRGTLQLSTNAFFSPEIQSLGGCHFCWP